MNENLPAVEVFDLKKTYKGGNINALQGVTFTVYSGEIFGLIGPNGAGKTTLIGCLLSLLQADSGSIRILGKPVDCMSVRKLCGYVPERSDFEHWMTARQFLRFHHGLSKQQASNVEEEIADALDLVELPESARDRRLQTYSRGMLQRLNLAQLMIGRPRVALLDEPTLGLDPTGVKVVRKIIESMRAQGITAIINSHQLDEIERLCDRVAFIKQGTIASIETLKGVDHSNYKLFIRWTNNQLNGTLRSVILDAAEQSTARIDEYNHQWGRFIVKDSVVAATLLKELINRGVPIEEAVSQRMRLEQLFAQVAGRGDEHE